MFKLGNTLGGKSKIQAEFEKKCREYMDETGWKAIKEMAGSSDKKVKMWALERIEYRAFGKPRETHDVTARDGSLYGPDQLAQAIAELTAGETAASLGISSPGEATA